MVGVLGLLGLLFIATTMSHQLTPPAIILALLTMLLTRRLGRPELPIIIAVLFVRMAQPRRVKLLGRSPERHLRLNRGLREQVQFQRVESSDGRAGAPIHRPTSNSHHRHTLLGRGHRALRRFADSRTLEVLVVAPFLLVAAQNYGGEGLIRVVLFGLPFSSLLFASMFWPRTTGDIRSFLPQIPEGLIARLVRFIIPTLIAASLVVLAVATTVARGGNDSYQAMSASDLLAVKYVYAHAPAGRQVYVGMTDPYMPLLYQDGRCHP